MLLLFFVNLLCLIAEFSGLAASLEIFNISKYISIPISAFLVWMLVVKGTYKAVERTFLVLSSFYVAYIISGFIAHPDWSSAFKQTVLPSFDLNFQSSLMLIGMIGTTITPWMQFYLQSSVVEKRVGVENYKSLRLDVIVGCVVASIVAFFIVVACAATLFKENVSVQTVSDAALALRPLAGPYASFLFAFGLFNAAIFAVSILPLSTAYSICEGMGWEEGIDKNFKDAPQFFWLYTIMIAIGAGVVLIPNFPFLKMMYLSQVGNGILLPFILLFMLSLVNDEEIMGEFKNTPSLNTITYIVVAVLILLTILMLAFSLPFFKNL
jgi:Mn2+/Fe2+ NRAMP family transporter